MNPPPTFDALVREHGDTVLRVCRAVLGTHTDAEDAWSETFLAALRGFDQIAAIRSVQAWLVTIAHRKALDVLRTRSRSAITVADLPETPSSLGLPGAATEEIWPLLATLSQRQRDCLAYRYIAELSYREIAEVLGGSEEAARRATADGRAALRRKLGDLAPTHAPRTENR